MDIAAVEPNKTRPTTHGIRTAAVATRFQVMEKESPDEVRIPSHHIEGNKSRGRTTKGKADSSLRSEWQFVLNWKEWSKEARKRNAMKNYLPTTRAEFSV
jgi:hypothetical protein